MYDVRGVTEAGGEARGMSGLTGGPLGYPGNTDLENAEALLDESRGFLTSVEKVFDFFGLDRAAENLRRYRSGAGVRRSIQIQKSPATRL